MLRGDQDLTALFNLYQTAHGSGDINEDYNENLTAHFNSYLTAHFNSYLTAHCLGDIREYYCWGHLDRENGILGRQVLNKLMMQ